MNVCMQPESTKAWQLTRTLYVPLGTPMTWNTWPTSISGHSRCRCPVTRISNTSALALVWPSVGQRWQDLVGRSGRKGLVSRSCSGCSARAGPWGPGNSLVPVAAGCNPLPPLAAWPSAWPDSCASLSNGTGSQVAWHAVQWESQPDQPLQHLFWCQPGPAAYPTELSASH